MKLPGGPNRGILLLILLLSLLEPVTHLWIAYAPPEGTVPSGLHTGDSAIYLHSMAAFENGFHTPFATTRAEYGPDSFRYYAPPYFLLYSVVGWLGRMFGIPPFLFLGLANGIAGGLYLWSAYHFLRTVFPRRAGRAFLLFALPGGLGGILYLLTGIFGLHSHPGFTESFERLAHYELIEGQHLSPMLLMPRLYYTLPLALGFLGLTKFIQGLQSDSKRTLWMAALCNGLTTAVNFRVGPLLWGVATLYAWSVSKRSPGKRARACLLHFTLTAAGGLFFWAMLRLPPVFTENAVQVTSMGMWLLSFLTMTCFYWPFLSKALRHVLSASPPVLRYAAFGLCGYLSAYVLLYLLYQAYFGNWLRGGDTSAAIAVSDWALLGVLPGLLTVRFFPSVPKDTEEDRTLQWIALWFLLFLATALSAFGRGWFLQFTPQRLLVLMGLPLALLTTYGLDTLSGRIRQAAFTTLLALGLCSLAVASLCFQGPLHRAPGKEPFAYLHYEAMPPEDARLIEALGEGPIAVPPWSPIAFGEILSLEPGVQILGGPGAMNLGDQPFALIQGQINHFFDPACSEEFQRDFAKQWNLAWIYCPAMCPVDPAVLDALSAAPWLEEIAQAGAGRLFQVRQSPRP